MYMHGVGRKRNAAIHLFKTRLLSEEFSGLNEELIMNHMTDDQLEEFIVFMATRPSRARRRV